jgi:pimeloyl-ACP methyl ester carboxylesterase
MQYDLPIKRTLRDAQGILRANLPPAKNLPDESSSQIPPGHCALQGSSTSNHPTSACMTWRWMLPEVITRLGAGRAVLVGHAYGNWVARMTAVDHPQLVRGVVIAAAATKQYAPELTVAVTKAGDPALPDRERLEALRFAFFAPGNDAQSGSPDGIRRFATANAPPWLP